MSVWFNQYGGQWWYSWDPISIEKELGLVVKSIIPAMAGSIK
jgi:hypothetical protein